jgi:hypothetical protein
MAQQASQTATWQMRGAMNLIPHSRPRMSVRGFFHSSFNHRLATSNATTARSVQSLLLSPPAATPVPNHVQEKLAPCTTAPSAHTRH